VLGGGPGGYVAAERAGSLGKRVLLIEKETIGGVCLNRGCIPTKTLLYAAKQYGFIKKAGTFGITVDNASFDLAGAMAHKTKVVAQLHKGINSMLKRHGVEQLSGEARVLGPRRVEVSGTIYEGRNILIATGSRPSIPPIPGIEEASVMTSREALELSEVPKSLAIIGGGYIGMEFASLFSKLGTEVTVIEVMPEIIPFLDPALAKRLRNAIDGVEYLLETRVTGVSKATVHLRSTEGKDAILEAEKILLSAGRTPNSDQAGLAEAGVDIDRQGVVVNEYMQTNLPGVYACGDVTGRALLAHTASRMGEVAVDHMFNAGGPGGRKSHPHRMRYEAVPWVVFTSPEVAGCGLSPREAESRGHEVLTAEVPMSLSGRYLAENPGERGVAVITVEKKTHRILGVNLLGSGVSELIHSAAVMIEQELRVEDIRETIFPHPTQSEVLRDALWALEI
ncbi:MAG: dihydrolipoyl dehydrogenase, partial [Alkalispirochaetaceae bacterium]